VPGLERRQQVEDERGVVEPAGVGAAAVHHRPGAGDDVALVGVQQRERESVPDADETEPSGEAEDGGEREPRPSPAALL
jgi:hypothetical protein